MTFIYLTTFGLIVWIECSSKINTDNIFEKLGMGLIAIGCLISTVSFNRLIPIGLLFYFCAIAYKAYKTRGRRAQDIFY